MKRLATTLDFPVGIMHVELFKYQLLTPAHFCNGIDMMSLHIKAVTEFYMCIKKCSTHHHCPVLHFIFQAIELYRLFE